MKNYCTELRLVYISYRFKYFVALSDLSSNVWPSDEAKDHILFKGLQNLGYLLVLQFMLQRMLKTPIWFVQS